MAKSAAGVTRDIESAKDAVANGAAFGASMTPVGGTRTLASKLIFKSDHYASRLLAEGLVVSKVEGAVARAILAIEANMVVSNAPVMGRIMVNNVLVEWHAFKLATGRINVGTIFPVK
jgi:hypothetical protein